MEKRYNRQNTDDLKTAGIFGGKPLVSKYSGDRFFRYFNLLKKAGFGFSIRKSAIFNYLKLKIGRRSDIIGSKTTYPAIISVFALKRCNLKCSFCEIVGRYGAPANWESYELTPAKFTKILSLDAVKKALVICFTGGEPLLNKDLPELVRIARKRKYIVGMVTNGLLLQERLEEIKNIGIADIQLSVYENTKEDLRRILPGVSQYFPVNVSYVLPRSQLVNGKEDGFNGLTGIIKMCVECGCASFKFNICQPNSVTKGLCETIYTGDKLYDEFVEACKTALPMLNFSGYGTVKTRLPSRKFTLFFPQPPQLSKDSMRRNCLSPWAHSAICGNGEYGFCCNVLKLGNIFDDPNVINCDKARKIRKSLWGGVLPLESECLDCVFLDGAYTTAY